MTNPTRNRFNIKFPGRPVPGHLYAPILQSWRMGFNTYQIAGSFKVAECDVARIVAAEQNRRHREWSDAAPMPPVSATA